MYARPLHKAVHISNYAKLTPIPDINQYIVINSIKIDIIKAISPGVFLPNLYIKIQNKKKLSLIVKKIVIKIPFTISPTNPNIILIMEIAYLISSSCVHSDFKDTSSH